MPRINVKVAMGRFTGPTCEHEKLLDSLEGTDDISLSFVFVIGLNNKVNPQTTVERAAIIQQLYPTYKVYIQQNPYQALVDITQMYGVDINLIIHAGEGTEGVTRKCQGGSVEEYKGVVGRLERNMGEKFHSVSYSPTLRGSVSGTILRESIKTNEPFEVIRPMFHSRLTDAEVISISDTIRSRLNERTTII